MVACGSSAKADVLERALLCQQCPSLLTVAVFIDSTFRLDKVEHRPKKFKTGGVQIRDYFLCELHLVLVTFELDQACLFIGTEPVGHSLRPPKHMLNAIVRAGYNFLDWIGLIPNLSSQLIVWHRQEKSMSILAVKFPSQSTSNISDQMSAAQITPVTRPISASAAGPRVVTEHPRYRSDCNEWVSKSTAPEPENEHYRL